MGTKIKLIVVFTTLHTQNKICLQIDEFDKTSVDGELLSVCIERYLREE